MSHCIETSDGSKKCYRCSWLIPPGEYLSWIDDDSVGGQYFCKRCLKQPSMEGPR